MRSLPKQLRIGMETETIRQKVFFKAPPHAVFELLMDEKKHAAFTGHAAKISRKVGGEFSCYGGWIEGENVEVVADRKIAQLWRGADWPKGHFSKATFTLKKKGSGTELTFVQEGVPQSKCADISEGWKEHYWKKMKRYLGE